MKDHDEAGQLFVKRGGACPQTYDVEAWADALLQKHVWQGFLGVHLFFQNPREALLRHLIDNLLFSLEELEEDGDYL
jgi:surfactin synthase thioesterase subunit